MHTKTLITISLLAAALVSLQAKAQDGFLFLHPSALSSAVNTSADESHLVYDKNEDKLYFVRDFSSEKVVQDIYSTHQDNAKAWTTAKKFDYSEYIHAGGDRKLKEDELLQGRTRNVKHKHRKNKTYLRRADNWTPNTLLDEINGFSIVGSYTYHLNVDEDVLLISQNGKDVSGEEDLYVSLRNGDGVWNKPFSLGSTINTEGSEVSPFLSVTGDTLYFSSDGHEGYGGQDVFYAIREDETWKNWSTPTNMGEMINSTHSETSFILLKHECFFTSNRTGNYEVYESSVFNAPPIVFNIETKTDVSEKNGKDGSITLINLEPNFQYDRIVFYHDQDSTTVTDVRTNGAGMVLINGLIPGSYHHFEAYFGSKKAICLDDVIIRDQKSTNVHGVTQRGGLRPSIEEIVLFNLNSSYLDEIAVETLELIARKALATPDYKITIIAGLKKVTGDNYEQWLNERRVNRIRVYLISNGVNADRIETVVLDENTTVSDCVACNTMENVDRKSVVKVVF